VNSIEDGARAAMQAVAGSITDAPPLRLDPARLTLPRSDEARQADEWALRTLPPAAKRPARVHRGTGRMRRHRAWLAPLAAAAAIVAVALSLVLVKIHPNARVVSPSARGSAPVSVPAGSVPRYFAEIDPAGQWPTSTSSLLIADTYTGKTVATVAPPAGLTFQSVSAASDDRTFVLFVTPAATQWSTGSWYQVRIAPGTAHPATLTRLPVTPLPYVEAMAVSGSGRDLAVVQTGADTTQPDVLSIYSLATGGLLHSWTTRYGSRVLPYFAWNSDGPVAAWPTLTWVDGDRRIAFLGDPSPSAAGNSFTWKMRELDVTAKGSSLQADSQVVWTEQTPNSGRDKYGCDLNNPLAISPTGQSFVCASGTAEANGERLMKWLVYPTGANSTGRLVYQMHSNMGSGSSGRGFGMSDENDLVLWANPSGSTVIALWWRLVGNQPGDIHFGVISDGRFSPLPATLITTPALFSPTAIAW
jgi:hypothetical protein